MNPSTKVMTLDLNVDALPKKKCHIFSNLFFQDNLIMMSVIEAEYARSKQNSALTIQTIPCGPYQFSLCSFPQKDLAKYQKLAEIFFQKKLKNSSYQLSMKGKDERNSVEVRFPEQADIFWLCE